MKDTIYRQDAIDAMDVLCQEYRYKIPGKRETYSQYNEAWQDALGRAENAIGNLPSAQPERQMEGNLENVESPRLATYEPEECKQKSTLNADDLISRRDAMAYPLSWDHYDKEHGNRHFIAGIESYREYIEALPSAEPEITEDDVKEFCRKRCLIVVTSDLYDEMIRRWASAQPNLQPTCN